MLRVITFAPTDDHRRYFNIIWQGVLVGGNVAQQTAGYTGRAAIKQARRIKEAFRSVSVAPDDAPERRTLADAGGTCTLAEEDFARVLAILDSVMWTGSAIEDADDTFDFLDASEKKSQKDIAALVKP